MMKEKLFIVCICFIVGLVGIGGIFATKFVLGNRQLLDFNQHFNVAYISCPDGTNARVEIKTWKDWENSDSIQVVSVDGKPYYTHLSRVVLTKE